MGQVAVALSVSATARSRFCVVAWSVSPNVSSKQKDSSLPEPDGLVGYLAAFWRLI